MLRTSLTLFALLVAGPLTAQTITSPYRYIDQAQNISVSGGYLATDRGELETGPHSTAIVGARYSGRISGPISLEAGLSYLPSSRTVLELDETTADTTVLGEVNAHLLLADAGVRFQITGPRSWHGLAPHVGASVGVIADVAGTSDLEETEEVPEDQLVEFGPAFAVGAFLGTDWFLTERISVRAAGKGYLWRFSTPVGLAGVETSEWLRNFGGTIGIAVHF